MEHAYRNDPTFRALVDTLYRAFREGQYTPTDVRQASVAASIMLERQAVPIFIPRSKFSIDEQTLNGMVMAAQEALAPAQIGSDVKVHLTTALVRDAVLAALAQRDIPSPGS